MGVGKLSLSGRPDDIPTKQAAAAVGQCELMYTYDKGFSEYNHTVAQILLTGSDVDHEAEDDPTQSNYSGVDPEIFADSAADSADLAVDEGFIKFLIHCLVSPFKHKHGSNV